MYTIKGFDWLNDDTVKSPLSRHFRDLPKCPLNRESLLNRGCKICAMFVNN